MDLCQPSSTDVDLVLKNMSHAIHTEAGFDAEWLAQRRIGSPYLSSASLEKRMLFLAFSFGSIIARLHERRVTAKELREDEDTPASSLFTRPTCTGLFNGVEPAPLPLKPIYEKLR